MPFGWQLVREAPDLCEVLIEGRPDDAQLARVSSGGAVVVPFAGVPPATARALADRPDLTLHNLHHNAPETAETAMALLLSVSRRIVTADRAMRTGDWTPRYTPEECIRLAGKTAAVLGMGYIGRRIARACRALEMNVVGIRRMIPAEDDPDGFPILEVSRLAEALTQASVLILALPQTSESEGLIGEAELALLARPSILVNIARAQIVDERALYEALRSGVLHGAGLDVWYRYPKHPEGIVPGYFEMPEEARHTFPSEYPFHELSNLVMSPHRGGSSASAEEARIEHLAKLIRDRAETGAMANRVPIARGY